MRIKQLYDEHTKPLITESWHDSRLTLLETQVVVPFVNSIERYVSEAALTPDQIQNLFTTAEKEAAAGGNNRTGLGVAKDTAELPVKAVKWIDNKVKELGAAFKNAGPVKDLDAKFNELKAKLGDQDSKVIQAVKGVSDWAKANPGKATIAVAILTTAASLAGGPLGGAVAGFIARATKDLLQGKDLSSAVGGSIKTAAYGAIAGWAFNGIGDWLEGLRADVIPYEKMPGLSQVDVGLSKTLSAPGFSSVQNLGSMIVPADMAEEFTGLVSAARGGDVDAFKELWDFSKSFNVKDYTELAGAADGMAREIAQQNDAFLQAMKAANSVVSAIAQGSITGKLDSSKVKVDGESVAAPTKQESVDTLAIFGKRKLSEGQTYLVFNRIVALNDQVLSEGPGWDAVKKVGSNVVDRAKTMGSNLTNKVTADKLNKAWQAAGSPLDSDAVADILKQAGVEDEIVSKVYTDLKLATPGSAAPIDAKKAETLYTQVKSSVGKMNKKERQRLLAYMQKSATAA